jgi:hypothetical protein
MTQASNVFKMVISPKIEQAMNSKTNFFRETANDLNNTTYDLGKRGKKVRNSGQMRKFLLEDSQ